MTTADSTSLRVAVIGHVEHVTIGRADALPRPGEIVHLDETVWIPGGGGGIAFHQLVRGPGDVHLFTAIGNDDAGAAVERAIRATGAHVHVARRDEEPHTRDLVIVTPGGERTIFVVGEPLHPHRTDGLPWDVLATCDAVYFTGQDPHTLVAARKARVLVVTARRRHVLAASGVRADAVVGSTKDQREASTLADYPVPPLALVMTEGAAGGYVETADGVARFPAATPPERVVGTYGSGDSFAAALTWYLARDLPVVEACSRAAAHGAAVLRGVNPLEWQLELE
jgi:ribokinase